MRMYVGGDKKKKGKSATRRCTLSWTQQEHISKTRRIAVRKDQVFYFNRVIKLNTNSRNIY